MEPRSVVVIQDASEKVYPRVLDWALNRLSLNSLDKLTLVAILYRLRTPMGYHSIVDGTSMVGANTTMIKTEAARKKEEYLNNEELVNIIKQYESKKVEFKIEVVAGPSLREVALRKATDLEATWVILDRQMKKDGPFFLQMLSCGISIVMQKNQIEHLREPPVSPPTEIPCSHELYDPSIISEEENTFSREIYPGTKIEGDRMSPEEENTESSAIERERNSTHTIDNNQAKSGEQSEDKETQNSICENRQCLGLEKNRNEMNDEMKEDKSQEQEPIKSNHSETEGNFTLMVNNNRTAAQTKPDQPSPDMNTENNIDEAGWDLMRATDSKQMMGHQEPYLQSQNQEHMRSMPHEDLLDEQQEENSLENSRYFICSVCRNKRPNVQWQNDYTYEELQAATDGFSQKNCIAEHGYGSTFTGQLEGKPTIIVKKYDITDSKVVKTIISDVQLILKSVHKNVMTPLGISTEENHLLIAYEHACNGSLDQYLSKESCRPLTWAERMKVVTGTSRGLKYLHDNGITHGGIKPSNIHLTHDLDPMLGDFGLGKVKHEMKCGRGTGNCAYAAPECLESRKLSTRTDVYSFGVVLLELITGRRATDKIPGQKSLVRWAKPNLGGKRYLQLVDPIISSSYEESQLHCLVRVIEKCLKKNPKDRDTMNMIVSAFQGIADSNDYRVIYNFSPARSDLRCRVQDRTCLQGQTKADLRSQEKERANSSFSGEDKSLLRPIIENSHMIMGLTKNYQPNQEEQDDIESRYHVDDRTLRLAPTNNQMIGQRLACQTQKLGKDNAMNTYQDEISLDDSKSSVCSICKSRNLNIRWQKDFTYEELQAATNGFSVKNSLSEDEYGPTFRGQLESKVKIVVKRLQILETFKSEIQSLTNARHENVVMLWGSCTEECQPLLVYEYVCNGSLDQYLSRKSWGSLTWNERVKIAVGASRGLKYLHENNIVHGNIKSSNILLTHEFEPRLGDYGLGNEQHELKNRHKGKNVGNCGYTAPECLESGKLTTKTDVYSFGVVLLELITGCRIEDKVSDQKNLDEWLSHARKLLKGKKYVQLVDPTISSSCDEQQLVSLVQLTEKCLKKNPKKRLTMNMVVSALPCVVDDQENSVIKDFCAEKPYSTCSVSSVTSLQICSRSNEESIAENESKGDTEETENYKVCSTGYNEKKVSHQENNNHITYGVSNLETPETVAEDESIEDTQETENYKVCATSDNETKVSHQESENQITYGVSKKESLEAKSLSTKVYQKCETSISYGGAKRFFLGGAAEYTLDEQFFKL